MSRAMRSRSHSDDEALAARFFELAVARAKKSGRRVGDGADHDLRQITLEGATWILDQDEAKRRDLIRTAEADIVRLIEMAIENAEGIDGYPSDLLGEKSYFPAKMRFCPCRPFC